MEVGMSQWFLQSNSKNDIFILLMDDGPCWSYEINCQKKFPFATVKLVLCDLCVRWTERLGVILKDADKRMLQNQSQLMISHLRKNMYRIHRIYRIYISLFITWNYCLWIIKWRVFHAQYKKEHKVHVYLKNTDLFLKEKMCKVKETEDPQSRLTEKMEHEAAWQPSHRL